MQDELLLRNQAEMFALRAAVKALLGQATENQTEVARNTREEVRLSLDMAIDPKEDAEVGSMFREAVRQALDDLLNTDAPAA